MKKQVIKVLGFVSVMICVLVMPHVARAAQDTPIVVSMGDSFSCGEGLEPYYGQDDPYKYWNQDWVAHRSTRSWNARLKAEGQTFASLKANPINPSYEDVKDQLMVSYDNSAWTDGGWFDVTNSAATIRNIDGGNGEISAALWKLIGKTDDTLGDISYSALVAPQIEVIDYINQTYGENSVDYITVLVGGNDLNFGGFMTTAAINEVVNGQPIDISGGFEGILGQLVPLISVKQDMDALNEQLDASRASFTTGTEHAPSVRDRYARMFNRLRETAGSQANIIVVGYPTFFSGTLPTLVFTRDEMTLLDDYFRWLDGEMQALVDELVAGGFENLHYVSLIDVFEGHGVGTLRSYIENVVPYAREEELYSESMISAASFHPNERGSQAIADAVQAVIDAIEAAKRPAPGWAYENGAYCYYNEDGSLRTNAFASYRGRWFFLGDGGAPLVKSWVRYKGSYYYLGADGAVVVDGWVKSGGNYYYMGKNGTPVVNGWVLYNGSYYYLGELGTPIVNGWVKYNGAWYYFNANGVCVRKAAA